MIGIAHPRLTRRTIAIVLFVFLIALTPLGYAAGPGLDQVTDGLLLKRGVAPGTTVMGQSLGGLSRDAAEDALLRMARDFRSQRIGLRYGAKLFEVRMPDLGLSLDAGATLERVWAVGRSGSLIVRLLAGVRARRGGAVVDPVITVEPAVLHSGLIELAHQVEVQPVNAALDQETGLIRPGKPGRRLVLEAAETMVHELVAQGPQSGPLQAELPVEGLAPRVVISDLADLDRQVIGRFTTYFDRSVVGRSHNIARAAAAIDGEVLHPDDTFSFNETVGPTTAERGYEEAPELFKGKFIAGVGGGACQVSSTLYNSALLAGMQVVERYNHSRVLAYVVAGRDATVNYGGADFRFKNSTSYPVQLRATVAGGAITTWFVGRREPGPDIIIQTLDHEEIKPETQETVDESLDGGPRFVEEEGVAGLKVTVARVWVANGVEVRREVISRDVYPAFPEVAKVGPKPPEPPAGPTVPPSPAAEPENAGKETSETEENGR
ncbi:MAG: VanW family protein [Bacillota bacterium]